MKRGPKALPHGWACCRWEHCTLQVESTGVHRPLETHEDLNSNSQPPHLQAYHSRLQPKSSTLKSEHENRETQEPLNCNRRPCDRASALHLCEEGLIDGTLRAERSATLTSTEWPPVQSVHSPGKQTQTSNNLRIKPGKSYRMSCSSFLSALVTLVDHVCSHHSTCGRRPGSSWLVTVKRHRVCCKFVRLQKP